MQLAQQFANGRVVCRSFEHKVFKVLGHEQVVDQRLLDALGNLSPLLFQTLDAEHALARIGEIPAMQHRETVEALFQDVAQRTLVFGVQLLVLGVLAAPFLRLHLGTREDQQVAILEGIGRAGSRQQEADGVAALLQMIFDPAAQALVDVVRFLRQHQNGQAVVPALRLLGFIQTDPRIGLPSLR